MRALTIIVSLSLCFAAQKLSAQKETYNWYFGKFAGITFNTNPPSVLPVSQMFVAAGCGTISAPNGRLLFYSDGTYIWDSTHNVMPNASKLNSENAIVGATETGLVVPRPDSINRYYVFIHNHIADTPGLRYCEIDMKLNGGRGNVIQGKRNVLLNDDPSSTQIAAIKHANNKDYWIVTTKYNSDTVCAYLVTANGINHTPVKSTTGLSISIKSAGTGVGYMKFSPEGDKIAYANDGIHSSLIADFDLSTGKISNPWIFPDHSGYGLEFSSSGKYLYVSEGSVVPSSGPYFIRILQYDAKAQNKTAFLASRTVVDSSTQYVSHALQLGPDKKIYSVSVGEYLHVIHAPDSAGRSCRVQHNYIYLGAGKMAWAGLPTFVQSFFRSNAFDYTNNCIYDTTSFRVNQTSNLDSVRWEFGDPASGVANRSKEIYHAAHVYHNSGTYTIKLFAYSKTHSDTFTRTLNIQSKPRILDNDTVLCGASSIFGYTISARKAFIKYTWSTGAKTQSINVKTGGFYILSVIDSNSCKSTDTITLHNPRNIAAFILNDTILCPSASLSVHNTSKFINDSFKSALFSVSDGSSYKDTLFKKVFHQTNTFDVKLVITGKSGCKDSVTQQLRTLPMAVVGFNVNTDKQCLKGNSFSFTNTSTINKGNIAIYHWRFGDDSSSNLKNITGKAYLKDSTYSVSLITTSDKDCNDTLTKTVVVYAQPKPDFTIDKDQQCFKGNDFNFSNTSTIHSGNIASYQWNMGDGQTSSNKDVKPFSYTSEDTFNVRLIALSDKGCIDTLVKPVVVFAQPKAQFTVPIDSQCIRNNYFYVFNNSAIKYGTLSHYWDFGDGSFDNTAIPAAKAYSVNGTYAIRYKVISEHGCADSTSSLVTVFDGPKAALLVNDSIQCMTGHRFDLSNTTAWNNGSLSHLWLFDDGSQDQNNTVLGKQFVSGGYHPVKLVVSYTVQCTDTSSVRLYLETPGNISVDIAQNDSQCLKGNRFNFSASVSDPKVIISTYNWDFDDASQSKSTAPLHRYKNSGLFHVMLTSVSANGCPDTAYTNVVVLPPPVTAFTASSVCFPEPIQFTDLSTASGSAVNLWKWLFGDGTQSTLQNPTRVYGKPGTYNVSLIIHSAFGCADTLVKSNAAVVKPKPKAFFDFTRLAPANADDITFQFNNKSSGNIINQHWDFGDGNASNDINPVNNYNDTGSYNVQLTVTSADNCADTFTLKTPLLFPEFFFFLPDAFSPNTDNLNEIFKPVASRYIKTYTMQVYSRWGEKIFESRDITKGWDGTYMGKPCQDGMYLCKIFLMPMEGPPRNYQEMVVLLR